MPQTVNYKGSLQNNIVLYIFFHIVQPVLLAQVYPDTLYMPLSGYKLVSNSSVCANQFARGRFRSLLETCSKDRPHRATSTESVFARLSPFVRVTTKLLGGSAERKRSIAFRTENVQL